jgi:phosphate transport system permease protein
VLNGVPSIVMGIAIYSLIVMQQKHFSAFAGGVALGIMMIPTVTRTTEEMLLMVPHAIREAALGWACPTGARCSPSPEDGVAGHHHRLHAGLCARGRRDGSAALYRLRQPVLERQPESADRRAAAADLCLRISPYDEWHRLAWAGALVLIVLIVVSVSLVRIFVASRGVLKGAS